MSDIQNSDEFTAKNYCVSFVDVLGHKGCLGRFDIVPTDPADIPEFKKDARNSTNPILWLKETADKFLIDLKNTEGRFDDVMLPSEKLEIAEALLKENTKRIHWSDGIMFYSEFEESNTICPLNSILTILALSGFLILDGLSRGYPLRGGVEVGWGVEDRDNLYGKAVCRAYELESGAANYPRIVVGPVLIEYLNGIAGLKEEDHKTSYYKTMATSCLHMLGKDFDGQYTVHFLGEKYRDYIGLKPIYFNEVYKRALNFVYGEFIKFKEEKNYKLAVRYKILLDYFTLHPIREVSE